MNFKKFIEKAKIFNVKISILLNRTLQPQVKNFVKIKATSNANQANQEIQSSNAFVMKQKNIGMSIKESMILPKKFIQKLNFEFFYQLF